LFVDGVDHGGTFLLHRSDHFLLKMVQAISTHVVFMVDVAIVCLDRARDRRFRRAITTAKVAGCFGAGGLLS